MRKTIKVGKYHVDIQELEGGLLASVKEHPECIALFKREELYNIGDGMRVVILKYLMETGQTGLERFDAKVRRRLQEEAAEKKKRRIN